MSDDTTLAEDLISQPEDSGPLVVPAPAGWGEADTWEKANARPRELGGREPEADPEVEDQIRVAETEDRTLAKLDGASDEEAVAVSKVKRADTRRDVADAYLDADKPHEALAMLKSAGLTGKINPIDGRRLSRAESTRLHLKARAMGEALWAEMNPDPTEPVHSSDIAAHIQKNYPKLLAPENVRDLAFLQDYLGKKRTQREAERGKIQKELKTAVLTMEREGRSFSEIRKSREYWNLGRNGRAEFDEEYGNRQLGRAEKEAKVADLGGVGKFTRQFEDMNNPYTIEKTDRTKYLSDAESFFGPKVVRTLMKQYDDFHEKNETVALKQIQSIAYLTFPPVSGNDTNSAARAALIYTATEEVQREKESKKGYLTPKEVKEVTFRVLHDKVRSDAGLDVGRFALVAGERDSLASVLVDGESVVIGSIPADQYEQASRYLHDIHRQTGDVKYEPTTANIVTFWRNAQKMAVARDALMRIPSRIAATYRRGEGLAAGARADERAMATPGPTFMEPRPLSAAETEAIARNDREKARLKARETPGTEEFALEMLRERERREGTGRSASASEAEARARNARELSLPEEAPTKSPGISAARAEAARKRRFRESGGMKR